jgi:histone H3/H4
VHAPIEVRVTDSSTSKNPRAWLDQSIADGPTLYLNATLYRPFLRDVPHWQRYYAAFEYLMKDLGGKPHWAKNFVTPTPSEFWNMYPDLEKWVKLRDQVDPSGVFVTEWLKRCILNGEEAQNAIAEGHGFVVVEKDGEEAVEEDEGVVVDEVVDEIVDEVVEEAVEEAVEQAVEEAVEEIMEEVVEEVMEQVMEDAVEQAVEEAVEEIMEEVVEEVVEEVMEEVMEEVVKEVVEEDGEVVGKHEEEVVSLSSSWIAARLPLQEEVVEVVGKDEEEEVVSPGSAWTAARLPLQ